jgi:L-lactate dehydrogenase
MKVSIIGPGKVGMVLAYTLMMKGVAREIVLIGTDRAKAEGEAMDLMHAQAFLQVPVTVRAGELADTAGSLVVAVCASVPSPPGMTDRNAIAEGNAGGCHDVAGAGIDRISAVPGDGERHPGGFHPLP